MRIVIGKIGCSDTVNYAVNEFAKYVKQIDKSVIVDQRTYDKYDEKAEKVIFIGKLNKKETEKDRIIINLKNAAGYISGTNERSVLFAVYKVLEKMGCKWVRPSVDGEFIPSKKLAYKDFTMELDYAPSYKHRGICIEGADVYENIYDMINWMPKVGLNEYFIQFHNPFKFFDRWYQYHKDGSASFTREDSLRMTERIEEEIALRKFTYHKVGHGWTYPLIGQLGSGWYKYYDEIPASVQKMFAKINGKREMWHNSLFDTNLCYSNPTARKKFITGIVNYCKENPTVDYIHFWLADAMNNQCECNECKKMMPSEYYVMMLNELDEMLTAEGIKTKIVFLLYLELLWAPKVNKIKNPDRFILMFAPITRSYQDTYCNAIKNKNVKIDEYVRNKIELPKEVDKNLAFLKEWQKIFKGDSFLFDYHVMWDYALDAGCYRNARVLHDDMKDLDIIGLDGMMSCQIQRVSAPTCLSTYSMARALWDKTSEFKKVANDYFTTSFDCEGKTVEKYLKALSKYNDSKAADKYEKMIALINENLPLIRENYNDTTKAENYHMSWAYLLRHAEMWLYICDALILKNKGDTEGAKKKYIECCEYLLSVEEEVQRGLDTYEYIYDNFASKKRFGISDEVYYNMKRS